MKNRYEWIFDILGYEFTIRISCYNKKKLERVRKRLDKFIKDHEYIDISGT